MEIIAPKMQLYLGKDMKYRGILLFILYKQLSHK